MKMLLRLITLLCFCTAAMAQTSYIAGQTYFGENNYIEYKAGNLPIVISAPHGGSLEPSEIPNRSCSGCSTTRDSNTEELSRQLYDAIFELFGCYPHVIINRLHRRKLDANREIGDAADGNDLGEQAWRDFHDFIDAAKGNVEAKYEEGLYLDIHGHGHDIQRLELGYRITKSELQLPSSILNQEVYVEGASIKHLVNNNLQQLTLSELLQGAESFGEFCQQNGYDAVPSQSDPYPLSADSYFRGGYNTERHGSSLGGTIDGIQIECNMDGVRDNHNNRAAFAAALALAVKGYLEKHYFGVDFLTSDCGLATSIEGHTALPTAISVQLFPNPIGDILSVDFEVPSSFQKPVSVLILNQVGQIIYQANLLEVQSLQIATGDFPKGAYFLQVKSADFVEVERFLKIE